MDKESQTKIVLQRTIAGQDFSDLSRQANTTRVFARLPDGRERIRVEDVFKDSSVEPVQKEQPRRAFVVEVRRKLPTFKPKP